MRHKKIILILFISLISFFNCETTDTGSGDLNVPGEDGGNGTTDTDADTDTDTDTDADTDNDTDADTDSDNDTDADTDSDNDTDSDSDSDSDGDFEECADAEGEAENLSKPVDIVWFIDNSGSMSVELFWVKIKINNEFANFFNNSGLDYHLVLISKKGTADDEITVPDPLGSDTSVFLHIDEKVNSNDGLQKIISTYPQWQDFMREDAMKVFIATTDDDSDMDANTFKTEIAALTDPGFPDGFTFHGIIACCLPVGGCINGTIFGAAPGLEYRDLINDTGGIRGDLCSNNWTPIFNELANAVIESVVSCNYEIPDPGNGEDIDPTKVNVTWEEPGGSPTTIPKVNSLGDCAINGWYYDDENDPTEVILCPETCDAIQDIDGVQVKVVFGCDTIIEVD